MPLSRLSRRTFLRASGVSISLPLLDAMSSNRLRAAGSPADAPPKRMVLVSRPLGLHAPYFFPETSGPNYQSSRYLKRLEAHRREFTVFSGMSHHYGGGHGTGAGLFTGVAPEYMRQGDIRNTISLDQQVAAHFKAPTRYASLTLGKPGLSWNRKGVAIPPEGRASRVFKQLFVMGTKTEIAHEVSRIENGQSILDGVREQANTLARQLGASDRDRIDLLLTSIREAEQRLQQDQQWVLKPKPKVDMKPFTDPSAGQLIEKERQWFDLVHLALQTDSTRVISLNIYSHANVSIKGEQIGHHEASHHGKKEDNIQRLATIEEAEIKALGDFLGKLKATNEGGVSLLDQTQVLYAGDLGNASAHTTSNLPILLAGGGFKHAGHVAFDRKNNKLMSNLFVRMLQQLDIDMDRFGNSNGIVSEV
jgi:hypothetical protein